MPSMCVVLLLTRPATSWLSTLSLHDALPIWRPAAPGRGPPGGAQYRARRFARAGRRACPPRARRVLAVPRALRLERSEEHTSELQSRFDLVCRLLLEKKN